MGEAVDDARYLIENIINGAYTVDAVKFLLLFIISGYRSSLLLVYLDSLSDFGIILIIYSSGSF